MQSRRRNFADRFSPEYRKFGRGGGSRRRGPQNSPPPTLYLPAPPLRRRAEVLREAGRLAAEYLAAKGLLPAIPSSAGAEKWWPNGGDDEADRASAFSRLGRRKIDGDDGGFRTKRRVRRRRHRGESHRRHDSDRGKEDAGAPHWAMDADDLEKPWRFPGRERRFPDAIDDGESDRRSLSEESDDGNGDPDRSKTLRSPLDHDQLLRSNDGTTDESENESGAKAMESSETKAAPAPDPVPDSETNSKAESKELQKEEAGENAEIPPSSSEGNMTPANDEIKENSIEESKIKSEEQTNLPSAAFKTCDLNSIEATETTTSATLERETSITTIFQQKANPAVVIDLEDEPDDRIIGGSEADPQNLEDLGGIQGGYGIEDTLFMSIGDIPINFMDVWDQAPGEYEKFF